MDKDTMTPREAKAALPSLTPKHEMILIGEHIWKKGPDGLWYRLENEMRETTGGP